MLKKSYFPYVVLLIVVLISFFQVAFNLQPLKFDTIDCFFPWRFYIGECLQNGQLPYWNPYQDLGYPIHADPSSGAWYPAVWLIGSTFGYSIYSISFEFLLHIYLAGVGMFLLARTLKFETKFALMAGIAYMLSGFFVGNAQHLSYIISGCWLPFIIQQYLLLIEEKKAIHALQAGLFMFLSITGGYPAVTIILTYLLLTFYLIHVISLIRSKSYKSILQFTIQNGLFLATTILCSAVMLVSVAQVSPYLSRLGNFNVEQALFSPFSPQSFISFLAPLTTIVKSTYWDADLSMRNGYFGLIILMFFPLGIFIQKPKPLRIIFWFGIFSLTASVGNYLPVRTLLFNHVPLMNVFRFPSVFRLFFILAAILTGIYSLHQYLTKTERKNWHYYLLIAVSFATFLILLFAARSHGYLGLQTYYKNNLFKEAISSTFWQNLAVNSLFQLSLLVLLGLTFWRIKNTAKFIATVIFLLIMDLVVSVQLVAPYTVFYEHVTAKEAQTNVARYPHGFPKQKAITIDSAAHLPGIGQPFWQNQQVFQKQISAEGFNSFSFTSYELLESDYPSLFKSVKASNLLTLSDLESLRNGSIFVDFGSDHLPKKYNVVSGDTAILKDYDAASFHIETKAKNPCLLILYQKEYTGWEATINGKGTPIFKSNLNFMTVELPAGKSKVVFNYRNPLLKGAFYVSLLSIFGALIFILWKSIKSIRLKH
ncbi:MAG: YfhO family protein [Flavobacteriia bacterium]